MEEPSDRELRWRDYALNAQLYQFYMDMAVKVNVVYFGITGGILSFCLTRDRRDYTLAALLLPIFFSVFFAVVFAWGSHLTKVFAENTAELAKRLNLDAAHNFSALPLIYFGCTLLQLGCVVGIGTLLAILWLG